MPEFERDISFISQRITHWAISNYAIQGRIYPPLLYHNRALIYNALPVVICTYIITKYVYNNNSSSILKVSR